METACPAGTLVQIQFNDCAQVYVYDKHFTPTFVYYTRLQVIYFVHIMMIIMIKIYVEIINTHKHVYWGGGDENKIYSRFES